MVRPVTAGARAITITPWVLAAGHPAVSWAAVGMPPPLAWWWCWPAGPLLQVAAVGGLALSVGGCPCCGQPLCLTGLAASGALGLAGGAVRRWRMGRR